jgi:hypothetical protein
MRKRHVVPFAARQYHALCVFKTRSAVWPHAEARFEKLFVAASVAVNANRSYAEPNEASRGQPASAV